MMTNYSGFLTHIFAPKYRGVFEIKLIAQTL